MDISRGLIRRKPSIGLGVHGKVVAQQRLSAMACKTSIPSPIVTLRYWETSKLQTGSRVIDFVRNNAPKNKITKINARQRHVISDRSCACACKAMAVHIMAGTHREAPKYRVGDADKNITRKVSNEGNRSNSVCLLNICFQAAASPNRKKGSGNSKKARSHLKQNLIQ